MILMDSKAQLTVDIIAKVVEGRITIANAAKLLSKSRRSIERYVKRYQQVGIQFVVHGNSGKSPPNKVPTSIKKAVQSLIKDNADSNLKCITPVSYTHLTLPTIYSV